MGLRHDMNFFKEDPATENFTANTGIAIDINLKAVWIMLEITEARSVALWKNETAQAGPGQPTHTE